MRNYHIRYPEDMSEGEEPESDAEGGDVDGYGQDSIEIKSGTNPGFNFGIGDNPRR